MIGLPRQASEMGGSVSQVFRSGSALLSNRDGHKVSETTVDKVNTIFDALRANPKISIQRLEPLLLQIPKVSGMRTRNYKSSKSSCNVIFYVVRQCWTNLTLNSNLPNYASYNTAHH